MPIIVGILYMYNMYYSAYKCIYIYLCRPDDGLTE